MKKLFTFLFFLTILCSSSKATIHNIVIGTDFNSLQNLCIGDTLRFQGDSTNTQYYGTIQGNVYNNQSMTYDNFIITSFTNIATTHDHVLLAGDSSFYYQGMQPSFQVGGLFFNCMPLLTNSNLLEYNVAIFPNPLIDKLIIIYSVPKNGVFIIYNINNEELKSYTLQADKNRLEIIHLDLVEGIYFCKIFVNDTIIKTNKLFVTSK